MIQNGAKLVQSSSEIIEELANRYPYLMTKDKKSKQKSMVFEDQVTKEEKLVLVNLSYEPVHFEKLLIDTGLDTGKLMEVVFVLQMKGLIKEISAQYYVLHTLFVHS